MRINLIVASLALLGVISTAASAATFANGSFETGDFDGWTKGAGSRSTTSNSALTTSALLPGGSLFNATSGGGLSRSAVVDGSYVDPNIGALLGSTVYDGSFSARVENTVSGGYASVISQTVANYTDSSIFFAWKAVLQSGGHAENESAEMLIELTNNTTNTVVIRRQFNAGAGGVDTRFASTGDVFYTPQWQVEQLNLDASQIGDTFTLSVLGADCEPTGHFGYIFLDGFGAVTPPPVGTDVPEPASMMLVASGLLGVGLVRRKRG